MIKAIVLVLLMVAGGMGSMSLQEDTPPPAPPTMLRVDGGSVPEGGVYEVDLIASLIPEGLAGFTIRVSTGDTSIATPILFSVPDSGLTDLDISELDALTLSIVDLNGIIPIGAENFILGTLFFEGVSQGITTIQLRVERMDNLEGFPILTSTELGLITVTNSRDLDGDGITEDINGNGLFDFADVLELFRMLTR